MRKILLMCLPLLLVGCVVETTEPYYTYNEPSRPRVVVTENRVRPHRPPAPQVVVRRPRVTIQHPKVVVTENRVHPRKRVANRIKRVVRRDIKRAGRVKPHNQAAGRVASRKPHVTVSSNRVQRRTDSNTVIRVPEESRVRIS